VIEAGPGCVIVAHMPFADVGGLVSSLLKQTGKSHQPVAGRAAVGVVQNAVMVCVQTGQQACPNRGTERRGAKGIAKPRALPSKPIGVGRVDEMCF